MAITRIDVRTKSIQELMGEGEILSGRYWLPSFQRSYVWDSGKIKDFLDSIFHNYPIGSVILWCPSSRVVSDIDQTAVPLMDIGNNSQEPHFIIDGQQRITSLLLMFNSWRIERNGKEIKCDPISYDPIKNLFIKSAHRGIDFSKIVKAFCLHDTGTLTELRESTSPEVFERIRAKALQLLKYPISQYVMQTDIEDEQTFADMAEAFIRINKEGVKIGNIELMLSVLAGNIGGDLKQRIVDIDKNIHGRFEATLQPTLRFVFSNFGLKQAQLSNAKRFRSNIDSIRAVEVPRRDDILMRSARAFNLTLDFLEMEAGIKSALLLPSQITLVPLATYIYHRGIASVAALSEDEKRGMLEWFILANFMSHYGTAVDSRLNRDIQTIIDNSSENFSFEQLVANMPAGHRQISYDDIARGLNRSVLLDAGKRYLFLLYILLIRNGADDWTGMLLSSRTRSELERHHIFPQEHLRNIFPEWDDADPDDIEIAMSNLGNITWILGSENASIGASDPVDYLPQYLESAKHHFVPEDAQFWTKNGYDAFKEYRIREIYLAGKKLFKEIFTDENPKMQEPEDKKSGGALMGNGRSVKQDHDFFLKKVNEVDDKELANAILDLYEFGRVQMAGIDYGSGYDLGKTYLKLKYPKAKGGFLYIVSLKSDGRLKIGFWGIQKHIPEKEEGDQLSNKLLDKLSGLTEIKEWYKRTNKEIKEGEHGSRRNYFPGKNMAFREAFPDKKSLEMFKSAILDFRKEIEK